MTELFGRNLICVFTFIKRWFGWKCTEQAVHQVWEQEEQSVLVVGGSVLCPSVPVRAGLLLPDDTKPDPVLQPALPAPPPDGVPVGHAVSAPPLQDVLDHCHHLYRGTNKRGGGLKLYYIWYAWVGGVSGVRIFVYFYDQFHIAKNKTPWIVFTTEFQVHQWSLIYI